MLKLPPAVLFKSCHNFDDDEYCVWHSYMDLLALLGCCDLDYEEAEANSSSASSSSGLLQAPPQLDLVPHIAAPKAAPTIVNGWEKKEWKEGTVPMLKNRY